VTGVTEGPGDRPVLVFDGDCGFCSTSVRFIRRRIPTRADLVPWQRAPLATLGVTREQARDAVLWVGRDARVAAGPEAVAALLRDAGGAWSLLGRLLDVRPVRALAWPAYRWVSRNRHRLPGGTPACALPSVDNGA
jgi:predicted DCC family thiol-disulfide oxidoreductase YuxK